MYKNRALVAVLIVIIATIGLISCNKAGAEKPKEGTRIRVDIFYLPHRPAVVIVRNVESVLKKYPAVIINEYDFLDPANEPRIEAYGITGHSPVAIFINNKNTFTIEGRTVAFMNFPKGDAFVPSLEGTWTYEDIEKAIAAQ